MLNQLPIDIFIQTITYLPFADVISVCQSNKKLHSYCLDMKYNLNWKKLIDDTFGDIYDYSNKLKKIQKRNNIYNYKVYVNLIQELDPLTQLMIYYKQKDLKSVENPKFTPLQKFLALFLLKDIAGMEKHIPDKYYLSYIDILKGHPVSQNKLQEMFIEMVKQGNVRGIKFFLKKGASIHTNQTRNPLIIASELGHLNIVRYLIQNGADIHMDNDKALIKAAEKGNLNIVKLLIENGAPFNPENLDIALWNGTENGHFEVVKYLIQIGANLHVNNEYPLRVSSQNGNLNLVKLFLQNGADPHTVDSSNEDALAWAVSGGNLDVVKYLIQSESGKNSQKKALEVAVREKNLDIANYLISVLLNFETK